MWCMRRYVEYVIMIAATFYMAVLYRSTAFILVGYGEIIAGVVMLAYLLYMAGKVTVHVLPSSDLGEMGKTIPVDLLISNRGRLPVGKVKVRIQDEYPLFGEKKTTVFYATVPSGGRKAGETRIRLGFRSKHSGRIVLRIRSAQIYDFLGMLPFPVFRKRMGGEAILSVFPDQVAVPVVVERSTRDYAQEKEEQIVRGENQPKESWQIRDYQPGDRLRDIHWKLTAKTDDIMVNEHVTEIGCPVYLFLDYRETGKRKGRRKKFLARNMEEYLEIALSITFSLVENGCPHCLVWYDARRQDVCRMEIRSQEGVYLFFQKLEDFGSAPEGLSLEEWYQEKYRGNCGITRLTLNAKLQCLRNGEVVADYQGKNKKELLQKQELFV